MSDVFPCPYCGNLCEADFVDVGFGAGEHGMQASPYHCGSCGATQIGPHDTPRQLSENEKRTGFYAPDAPLPPEVNTFHGKFVGIETAKRLYKAGMLDRKRRPVA